nr:hypothetical protein [Tanacetum cinerariifolium]
MPGRQLGALLQTHRGNDQKKKLWKNNEAKMTLYNALPRKEYAKYSCVKPPRRKVKSLVLKAKVTREKTSDDSDSQGGADEDMDEEEEAKTFNLMTRNFQKFFCKDNSFGCDNQFGNDANRFGRGRGNSFGNKGGERSKKKGVGYNCEIEAHSASECKMSKETKAFVRGAWSGNEDGDEHQNDETCLMEI